MIDTFLLDLDGTLLPMDLDLFLYKYFVSVSQILPEIDPEKVVNSLKKGVYAMMKDGKSETNLDAFYKVFKSEIDLDGEEMMERFNRFYENDFDLLKQYTSVNEVMIKSVNILKEKNYKLVLATNPMFPMTAQKKRLTWAGFDPKDFVYVSSCDECHACKPSLDYYKEVLKTIDKEAEECIMVGNNVEDDMAVGALGVDTYLVTDYLINKGNKEYTGKQGSSEDFLAFVQSLKTV